MDWKIVMQIDQGCISHIGRRHNQQDAYGFSNFEDSLFAIHGGFMAVICDGMGGLEKGDEAAHLAVKTVLNSYMAKLPEFSISDALDLAVTLANEEVVKLGMQTGNSSNVGTTLAIAVIYKDELFWRSVGDSRIYLQRDNKLNQLSVDHTYTQELLQNLKANGITLDEALNHRDGAALVSYLGVGEKIKVDKNVLPMKLRVGDVLLVCSDGLYNSLNEAEFIEALQIPNAMKAAKELQHKTLDKQFLNQDNLTGVVLRLQKEKYKKRFLGLNLKIVMISLAILSLILFGYIQYKGSFFSKPKKEGSQIQILQKVIEDKPMNVTD